MFSVSLTVENKTLEQIFRHKVLKMFIHLESSAHRFFPSYLPLRCTQTSDEQPEPSAYDPPSVWILRRHKLHLRPGLVRLRSIILPKPIFKNRTRADRLVKAKFAEDRLFRAKFNEDRLPASKIPSKIPS